MQKISKNDEILPWIWPLELKITSQTEIKPREEKLRILKGSIFNPPSLPLDSK